MYMMAAFFVSISVYFFLNLLKKDSLANWLGFIVSTSLMLFSDYLPYLLIPTYILYLVLNRKKISKSTLKTFFPALIIILLTITPWLLFLPQQLQGGLKVAANSPAWAKVVGAPHISSLIITFVKLTIGRISVDYNLTYAILLSPIALFVFLLLILSFFRMALYRTFLWLWFLAPITLAFLIAFFIPVFAYFRFIFILPAFYILWASAINTINWPRLIRILLAIALFINIGATTIYLASPKFQRENWRDATAFVAKNAKPDSVVLFAADLPAAPFDYYNKSKLSAYGALKNFNANKGDVEGIIKLRSENKSQIFLFQYLSGITDPQGIIFQEIVNAGFKNTRTTNFEGVGFVYEFEK